MWDRLLNYFIPNKDRCGNLVRQIGRGEMERTNKAEMMTLLSNLREWEGRKTTTALCHYILFERLCCKCCEETIRLLVRTVIAPRLAVSVFLTLWTVDPGRWGDDPVKKFESFEAKCFRVILNFPKDRGLRLQQTGHRGQSPRAIHYHNQNTEDLPRDLTSRTPQVLPRLPCKAVWKGQERWTQSRNTSKVRSDLLCCSCFPRRPHPSIFILYEQRSGPGLS